MSCWFPLNIPDSEQYLYRPLLDAQLALLYVWCHTVDLQALGCSAWVFPCVFVLGEQVGPLQI